MAQLSSSTVFGDLTVTNNINIFGSLNSTSINIGGVRKDENWDIAYTHSQTAHAPSNANYYVHPSVNHIPTGGAAGNILQWSSSGTAAWKANGTTSQYLRGDGAWASPPNTATAVDDILDGSNSGTAITYKPYTTNLAATGNRFYTHNTMPTATTLLNLSSHLRITQGTIGTTLTVNGDIIGNGKVIARTTDGWLRLNPTYTSSPPATAFHSGVLIPSALSVSGNVGIGTTSPSEKLEVRGNIRLVGAGGTGDGSLEIWRGTNASWKILNTGGILKFQSNYTSAAGAYYDAMTLDYNTGNLWFKGSLTGGTVPWAQVTGKPSTFPPSSHTHSYLPLSGGTLTGRVNVTESSDSIAMVLKSKNNAFLELGSVATTVDYFYLQVQEHATHVRPLILQPRQGNIGIGIAAPTEKLHVAGNVRVDGDLYFTGSMTSGTVPWARISGAPATATAHPTWAQVTGKPSTFPPSSHTHSYLPLSGGTLTGNLYTSSSARIGVGTSTAPAYGSIHIAPDGVANGLCIGSTSNTFRLYQANNIAYITRGGDNARGIAINTTGDVGIGTTAPAYKLDVSGDVRATGTFRGSLTGNASTATTLATARTINGTSFNGSANITTANWGTARTLTIGSTGKSVNGSGNVSWTLAEIGAAPASHTHTASQVGLGNVQNYGIATQAQAQAGTANNVYMTPLRVKEAIASQVPDLPSFYKLLDSFISSGEVGIDLAAGIKNSMYRGKNLGTSVTSEQWANIANGTFKDMFIGDFWVINGTTYIIAAFNYYLNTSGTLVTTKHVTLVTAESMYAHRMSDKGINDEGYVGSEMYTTGLDEAKTRIHADFAGHVLTHKRYLCNAVADGQASAAAWFDSDVELMNEVMVYGSIVNGKSDYGYNIGVEKSQLPLFALRPDLVNIGIYWWLRDVVSALYFAAVGGNGLASRSSHANARGVRPVFSIF